MGELSHFDSSGDARMVNVGAKPETARLAVASSIVVMNAKTLSMIRDQKVEKGDVLSLARIAGIMATKRTSDLIPLCHPVRIDGVDIAFQFVGDSSIEIRATVQGTDRTGVEMEALTAVATAGLTIYDMCKSVDRGMRVTNIQLEKKSGGKSGDYVRS